MEGEALYLISIKMLGRGDVAMFDKVIEVFAQYHNCRRPKDNVYGFRKLVPQWKDNLVVNYERFNLEVFLEVAKLDLFNLKRHRGLHVAFCYGRHGIGRSQRAQ